ncbi:G-patch domain and KOW motifs-containing protein [Anopheles darlingi]|nr:G-patch domain and KOW motifs-containing protein [Anopheles darlingi]
MEEKKISFGFSKIAKKIPLQSGPAASVSLKKNDTKQFIECVEENSIKTVGPTEEPVGPLVIPLRAQDKITIPDRLAKVLSVKQEKQDRLNHKQKPEATLVNSTTEEVTVPPNETLEQQAAREILEAANQTNNSGDEQPNFVVPLLPEELPLDGAQESTLDDYETIPIQSFGMAMLRGMGLKEDPKKAADKGGLLDIGPVMRPKGLGLGADRSKLSKALDAPLVPPAPGEVLVMKIGAQVKVLAGKHQDRYGTIESIDEETSRVMVKFTLGGTKEWVNEYMVMLVSKEEYNKYSKVLNAAKYEEMKNREKSDNRSLDSSSRTITERDRQRPRRSRSPPRESENSARRRNRRSSQRESSSEGSFSGSENDGRNHHKRKHKKDSSSTASYVRTSSGTKKKSHKYKQRRNEQRRHGSDSESDDRHHKKKTKKSKKPRSRSRSRR